MREGVTKRANRDQGFAKLRMGQTRSAQKQHQVHLGNTKLNVLAFEFEFPLSSLRDFMTFERVGLCQCAQIVCAG